MTIDHLLELERHIAAGRDHYACPGRHSKEWIITRAFDKLVEVAQRLANKSAHPLMVYQLLPSNAPHNDCPYLVPVRIEEDTAKNIGLVEWALVETTEMAGKIRDVTFGPAPYFVAKVVERCTPRF